MNKEGNLRQFAKKEVEGLLSTKVINMRKEVEQGRSLINSLSAKKAEIAKDLD